MVDNANYANENANLAFDLHDCYRMDSLLVVAVLANEIHASYVVPHQEFLYNVFLHHHHRELMVGLMR